MTREEDQCRQCAMVRRSRALPLHGQMDEKGADCWSAHVRRVALVMEEEESVWPMAHTPLPC